ncbi:hypothetical protein [Streptomyces sp. NPDC127084]|uniref:hypothetical protein n=1 Tax=Streptomyces sp. NPDC127084 TaxID=3347133 RepID=UPI003649A5C3
MTQIGSTHVDALELLTVAARHLTDPAARRPVAEIPTLDKATALPFRPFASLALAMAAHALSGWEVKTFQVERARPGERIRYFTAIDSDPRRPLRACTVFVPQLGTQRVAELCGHFSCPNEAPAGPGSRCADHVGDPEPANTGPSHWLRLAGGAARAAEHARGGLTALERLTVHASRAGLPATEVRRALGMPAWTLDTLVDDPVRRPDDIEEADDPDRWPLVLSPVRDISPIDTARVYDRMDGSPRDPAPGAVLAREGGHYVYFPLRKGGRLLVIGDDDHCFTLEWWQVQEHLPGHLLARRAEERRRAMYEPPCPCGDCA